MPLIGLEDVVREWAKEVHDDAIDEIIADLHEVCPIGDTRELIESFTGPDTVVTADSISSVVAFEAEHASYTDSGTLPHRIPNGRGPVTFFWADGPDGAAVYTFDSVNHPGFEGTHWFTQITEAYPDYLQKAIDG